jgi:multidrug efflux system membrane fusion protein
VKLGSITDGLRVVRDGLKEGDLIVVNGLQRVRPGMPVAPVKVAMAGDAHTPAGATPANGEAEKPGLAGEQR